MARRPDNVVPFRRRPSPWTRPEDCGARGKRAWWQQISPIMVTLPLAAFTAVWLWPGEWPRGAAVEAPDTRAALPLASEAELRSRVWPRSAEALNAEQPGLAAAGAARRFTDGAAARFSICGGSARVNCVVDGDTFWYAGEKIRIADINTPEVSEPACAREAALGAAATARLQDLLNEGAFTLEPIGRERDRYGRELRTVTRGGESLGQVLVREGLAEEWSGRRGSWC